MSSTQNICADPLVASERIPSPESPVHEGSTTQQLHMARARADHSPAAPASVSVTCPEPDRVPGRSESGEPSRRRSCGRGLMEFGGSVDRDDRSGRAHAYVAILSEKFMHAA